MTLANRLKFFIINYITEVQYSSNYEDALENAVDELFALCTTEKEREIVRAIISLEEH